MDLKLILQIAGFALGMLYLWLEYRASIRLWLVGLVMPLVHGLLYFEAGLYADSAMNGYYLLAGIYGWVVWQRAANAKCKMLNAECGDKKLSTIHYPLSISRTPVRLWGTLAAACVALHAAIYFLLTEFTNSTVPFWDSLTTALSIVAMWMLSRKFVEQWLVWLVVNAITVGLYLYKEIPVTAALYAVYLVMSVAGYLRWKKMLNVELTMRARAEAASSLCRAARKKTEGQC